MPITVSQTTFAELLFILPPGLASFEILTGPAFAVRVSVNVIVGENGPAVMIHHYFIGVDFFRGELSTRRGNLEEIIADAIARSDVNKTVVVNRRRNDGDFPAS